MKDLSSADQITIMTALKSYIEDENIKWEDKSDLVVSLLNTSDDVAFLFFARIISHDIAVRLLNDYADISPKGLEIIKNNREANEKAAELAKKMGYKTGIEIRKETNGRK